MAGYERGPQPAPVAVLWGGQGGTSPRESSALPLWPLYKNWLQCSKVTCIAVFTACIRIAGVKLHDSLSHSLRHPEFLPPSPKYRCGHPVGHPKLLQL